MSEFPFNPSRSEEAQQQLETIVTEGIPFHKIATLTSAAGATPVSLIGDAEVDDGKKVYVQGFILRVDGATVWAVAANVKIQDTNDTPVDFVTDLVADLTANAIVMHDGANVTLEDAMSKGSGGTAGRGLQVVADADGTGSDLIVQVWGVIK